MRHLLILVLAYAAMLLETNVPGLPVNVAWLHLLAGVAACRVSGQHAVLWAAVLGLAADMLASGPVGLGMICFVGVASLLRFLVEDLSRQSLHVVVASLFGFHLAIGFLETATRWVAMSQSVQPDWLATLTTSATTWLFAVITAAMLHVVGWIVSRYRQRTTGGAVGNPVGLAAN